jgi:LysR family hydrogen peroxide-inducible transcriptional activator
MRPTIRQLRYIVALADTGKYSEAAKRVHVSQPALSAQIQEVEADLGIILFERGRQGAIATPAGVEIIRRARTILEELAELRAFAKRGSGELTGRIELGVLPSIGAYLVPQLTRHLQTEYKDLQLSVREERTSDLDSLLNVGDLDVILSTANDHADCISVPMFDEQLWVVAARDHKLSQTLGPVSPELLSGEEFLTLGYGHRLSLVVESLAKKYGAQMSAAYRGTSLDAVRQMALIGYGLAILPSFYALSEAARDRSLVLRPIDDQEASRTISLCWRSASPLGSTFGQLGDVIKGVALKHMESLTAQHAKSGI